MWLVLESGLDLTIAPLAIWSVGWIMPLHQIQSTPDMSRTAVKRDEKSAREKKSAGKEKQNERDYSHHSKKRIREALQILLDYY